MALGSHKRDLGMPGLSDWSHDSGQEPAVHPPTPTYPHIYMEQSLGMANQHWGPISMGGSQPRSQQLDPRSDDNHFSPSLPWFLHQGGPALSGPGRPQGLLSAADTESVIWQVNT